MSSTRKGFRDLGKEAVTRLQKLVFWGALELWWGPLGRSGNPEQMQLLLEMPVKAEQEGGNPWFPPWVTC